MVIYGFRFFQNGPIWTTWSINELKDSFHKPKLFYITFGRISRPRSSATWCPMSHIIWHMSHLIWVIAKVHQVAKENCPFCNILSSSSFNVSFSSRSWRHNFCHNDVTPSVTYGATLTYLLLASSDTWDICIFICMSAYVQSTTSGETVPHMKK